jgi:hypothetical protein
VVAGGTGTTYNGLFGPAVRRLGLRVKMARRELRRRVVRLKGVFGRWSHFD